jgi:hypothetical protein
MKQPNDSNQRQQITLNSAPEDFIRPLHLTAPEDFIRPLHLNC